MRSVYPKKTNEVLINPGKGFVYYSGVQFENMPEKLKDYKYLHDECLSVASCYNLKLSWIALQPNSEDEYNWDLIDYPLQLAEKYGKKVLLGFGSVVSTGGVFEGVKSLVPSWVFEAGAGYYDIEAPNFNMGGTQINRIPEWECPIYREKNENFIKAIADRYDGHPYVECVINFTHGNWGEWHHFDINNRNLGKENLYVDYKGRQLDLDFFKYYVDLFPRFFKKTPLMIPTNVHDVEDELEPWVKYAIDTYSYGLKREGLITIPDCTYAMKYCAGIGPAFGEWQNYYGLYKADGRWDDRLIDKQIVDGKLTHCNLGYYGNGPLQYIKEKPAQAAYWANHLGYYYSFAKCTYQKDGALITIRNDGVCPTYLDVETHCVLVHNGSIVKTWKTSEINLKSVEEKQEETFHVSFDAAQFPDAVLGLSFTSGNREVLFANAKNENGYYMLQDDGNVYVQFDNRPRQDTQLTGVYMGIDFGDQWWHTALQHDTYKTHLYPWIPPTEHTMYFTLPEGKELKSFRASGEGKLTVVGESGEKIECTLSALETEYKVDSVSIAGKVSVRMYAPFGCFNIHFTEIVYGD